MAAANQPDRGDDREAIDRAFADLVAGYHLTAERADPPAAPSPAGPAASSASEPEPARWADDHPLFRHDAPPPDPATRVEPEEVDERFVPPPPPPLPKQERRRMVSGLVAGPWPDPAPGRLKRPRPRS